MPESRPRPVECAARPNSARALIREVGYPVVAKPDVGVGAARTYLIRDPGELDTYLASKPASDYIIEEFVVGDVVSYDGLTDRDGEVVFDSSMVYSTGVMESVMGADISYYIPRHPPDDLVAIGRATVAAFDVRERPFHLEYFRLSNGSLVALEVNMRPPGGLTVDMFNHANDMDFHRAWARMLVHGTFDTQLTRPYNCLYVGRKRHRTYAMPHDEVLQRYGEHIVQHQPMEDIFHAAIGDYGYVLRHPDLPPLTAAAASMLAPA